MTDAKWTAVSGGVAVGLVRDFRANVAVVKRAVAEQVRGVLLAGDNVVIRGNASRVEGRGGDGREIHLTRGRAGRNNLQSASIAAFLPDTVSYIF